MGIRTIKAAQDKLQKKSSEKRKKSILRGILTVFFALLIFVGLSVLRYGKQHFFDAPTIHLEDFLSGPAEISPQGAFVIPFDQRMNKESVKAALSIRPEREGEWVWDGRILKIRPKKALLTGDEYLITIDKSAKNIFSQNLERSYELKYEVGFDPQIRAIYPQEDGLEPGSHLSVLFSHSMISREDLSDEAQQDFFQMSPRIKGEWKWYNEKTLAFHPKEDWEKSTRYQFINTRKLKTLDGALISQDVDRTLFTERFTLLDGELQDTQQDIHEPFLISFNQAPKFQSLKNHIVVKDDSGKKVPIDFSLAEEAQDILLIPSSGSWDYDEEYVVSLDEGLMPTEGNLSLENSKELSFQSQSLFIINYDDRGKAYYSSEKKSISFSLREERTMNELKERIVLSPAFPWELKKSSDTFTIHFEDVSQKRENIKMIYIEKEIEKEIEIEKLKIEILFEPAPALSFSSADFDQFLCVSSSNNLSESSVLVGDEKRGKSVAKAKVDEEQNCPESDNEFSFLFEKKFFEPNKVHDVELRLVDVHGNTLKEKIQIATKNIASDERKLERTSSLFYHNVQSPEDLSFTYQTENIEKVHITLCKIDAKSALEIETSYEQRWFSFDPTPEKCLKFERIEKELPMKWGESKERKVSVSEMIDESETGIYYFHITAPGYYTSQGDPLEMNIALQYSEWSLLSKRGTNSLLWLYDHKSKQAVQNASLSLVSNDGILLDIEETDEDGTVFLPENRLKYDFVMAKKGTEELLLSVFAQEGIEASRFNIPIDIRDRKYQHQFYIEDPSQNDDAFKGVFILNQINEKGLSSPNVSQGIVVLYDQEEKLIWRSYEDFDEFGSMTFSIPQRLMILGGRYQLEVCLGLHQGLCQGESFWTFFDSSSVSLESSESFYKPKIEKRDQERIIQLGANNEMEIGQEIPVLLKNITAGEPLIISAERDGVYWYQMLTPESSSLKTSFTVTEEMIPEIVLSVLQFGKDKLHVDMQSVNISRKAKELSFLSSPDGSGVPDLKDSKNKKIKNFSYARFALFGSGIFLSNKATEAFYPRLGTSVISAANIPYTIVDVDKQSYQQISANRIQDAVIINGILLSDDEETSLNGKQYLLAQDGKGSFANLLTGEVEYDDSLEVSTVFPRFIRPMDKLVYSADVLNRTEANKNLQIINSSPHLRFPNGASMYLGLPAQESRLLDIAAEMPPSILNDHSSISMSIAEQGSILSSLSVIVPVIHEDGPLPQKMILQSQSNTLQTTIDLPLHTTGEWKISTIIAPSPVAFVLENLRLVLAQKTIDLEEMVTKMGLAKDFEEFINIDASIDYSVSLENELAYLKDLQFSSGGWAHFGSTTTADPLLSASIAKSLSLMLNAEQEVSEQMIQKLKIYLKSVLDEKSNERVRSSKTASEMSPQDSFEEILILHGLSSLTPSGVSYANNWYNHRESLSNESLVLLLLVFEDYRDAGLNGNLFKIEEIIQTLKQQSSRSSEKSWLRPSSELDHVVNEFVLTSWYLESLVRQASSHSDIPPIINWLIEQKNLQENQSLIRQSAYLQAMGAYLKIYQEQINSPELVIDSLNKNISYDLETDKKGQAFFLKETIIVDEEMNNQSILISSEQAQPLFVEVIAQSKEQQRFASQKGLAVFHDIPDEKFEKGDVIKGEIIIISDELRERVLLIQPQISGALPMPTVHTPEQKWVTLNSGAHQKWYLISELPEGETRIPFQWKAEKAGVYQVPAVYAYESRAPEVYGTSQRAVVEIR